MMNNITTEQFDVPLDVAKAVYSNYYLLHWSGTYLYAKLTENKRYAADKTESISHNGVEYYAHLVDGLSYWILLHNRNKQYALSFRLPKDAKYGDVLIKSLTH